MKTGEFCNGKVCQQTQETSNTAYAYGGSIVQKK